MSKETRQRRQAKRQTTQAITAALLGSFGPEGPADTALDRDLLNQAYDFYKNKVKKGNRFKIFADHIKTTIPDRSIAKHVDRFPEAWPPIILMFRAWALSKGNTLPDDTMQHYNEQIDELERKIPDIDAYEAEQKRLLQYQDPGKLSRDDKFKRALSEVISTVEGMIDDGNLDIKKVLADFDAKPAMIEAVKERYQKRADEMGAVLAGTDPQLKEAFSNIPKREIRKEAEMYNSLLADCDGYKDDRRTNRTPTARKARKTKPGAKTKHLKLVTSTDDLGITSLPPDKMVGAKIAFVYNTTRRLLKMFIAQEGKTLDFNRTSVLNYDEKLSFEKRTRKPKEQVSKFSTATTREATRLFAEIATTNRKLKNARLNAHCMIVRAL